MCLGLAPSFRFLCPCVNVCDWASGTRSFLWPRHAAWRWSAFGGRVWSRHRGGGHAATFSSGQRSIFPERAGNSLHRGPSVAQVIRWEQGTFKGALLRGAALSKTSVWTVGWLSWPCVVVWALHSKWVLWINGVLEAVFVMRPSPTPLCVFMAILSWHPASQVQLSVCLVPWGQGFGKTYLQPLIFEMFGEWWLHNPRNYQHLCLQHSHCSLLAVVDEHDGGVGGAWLFTASHQFFPRGRRQSIAAIVQITLYIYSYSHRAQVRLLLHVHGRLHLHLHLHPLLHLHRHPHPH